MGQVPSWVYAREIESMKTANFMEEQRQTNKMKEIHKDIQKILDVVADRLLIDWKEHKDNAETILKEIEFYDEIVNKYNLTTPAAFSEIRGTSNN